MKKIIFVLATIMSFAISSCTNDEIEVITKGKLHSVKLQIKPQGVYDEFGITNDITDRLRGGVWELGVYTLLYDSNGNLVDSNFSKQKSFNNINVTFSVESGSYTLVTIESLVDASKDTFDPYYFSIEDIEKSSTLKIKQLRNQVSFINVFGVDYKSIHVSTKDVSQMVTPSAIGSLIDLDFYNFNNSNFTAVGFGTDDIIESYLLDPSITSRNDRFYKDLSDEGYFRVRAKVDDLSEERKGITVYVLESSIDYTFCHQTEKNSNSWTTYGGNGSGTLKLDDGDFYYAGYCHNDDIDKRQFIMTKDVNAYITWRDNLGNVTPPDAPNETDLVPELYMTWGGSVNNVQSFMSSYQITYGSEGAAGALDDGTFAVAYSGIAPLESINHFFASQTTGLFEIDLYYDGNEVDVKDFDSYYNDNGYIYESGFYFSSDYKTVSMPMESDGSVILIFTDYDYVIENMSVNSREVESLTSYCQNRALQLIKEKNIASQNNEQSFNFKIKKALPNNAE